MKVNKFDSSSFKSMWPIFGWDCLSGYWEVLIIKLERRRASPSKKVRLYSEVAMLHSDYDPMTLNLQCPEKLLAPIIAGLIPAISNCCFFLRHKMAWKIFSAEPAPLKFLGDSSWQIKNKDVVNYLWSAFMIYLSTYEPKTTCQQIVLAGAGPSQEGRTV